jgi:hypothetical protein
MRWFWIIVLVVAVAVATWWMWNRRFVKGGAQPSIFGAGSSVVDDTMAYVNGLVAAVGTDKHLIDYLCRVLEFQTDNLRWLIERAAATTKPATADDLIVYLDLRYYNAISADHQAILAKKRIAETSATAYTTLLLDTLPTGLSYDEKQTMIARLSPVAAKYTRFGIPVATSTTSKLRRQTASYDTAAFTALVKVALAAAKPKVVIQQTPCKLDTIDLIEMYPLEPYRVREFISRIKKQIAIVEAASLPGLPLTVTNLREAVRDQAFADFMQSRRIVDPEFTQPAGVAMETKDSPA